VLTNGKAKRTIVRMKIIADTNTFLAVALNEPEKDKIIRLTEDHELIAADVLPFEIGNALTAMMKKGVLKPDEVASAWEVVQQIPVDLRHTDIKAALFIAARYNIYAYDAYFWNVPITFAARCLPSIAVCIGLHERWEFPFWSKRL